MTTIFKRHFIFFIIFFISGPLIAFETKKSEIGLYLSSKVYEEKNPVDNSFFMSQDGFMLGVIFNGDDYENNYYTGYRARLGYGQVDYTSAGTGTMTGIPDYQLEGTLYIGKPFDNKSYRVTALTGLGYRYLLNASGYKVSSNGYWGYDENLTIYIYHWGLI